MARRSARLTKSITPAAPADKLASAGSTDSDETLSPHIDLPSVRELPEPGTSTPKKHAMAPASKLPQSTGAQTPARSKSTQSLQAPAATGARTPNNRTPIKPAGVEMHPAHHHASTAKVLDEARWLGFQALGAHTAPPKAAGVGPGTPSKTPIPASKLPSGDSSPDGFRFRFKSPFVKTAKRDDVTLSPTTRDILKEPTVGATPGGSRVLFNATEFSGKADVSAQRKKAEPKGKMARFSDIHMAQFKKMDSIANHPSAFRADPNRFKSLGQSLQKSPSKADLTKPESSKLKRTQSKMDVTETTAAAPSKRTESAAESSSKIPPTPLKRTQSKIDLAGSGLPRSQSMARVGSDNPTAKRIKHTEADDASTTRETSKDNDNPPPAPTPARKITSQTALPRLASRLMTPTKSSVARSQSVKVSKTTSMIPSMSNSPSTSMFSPSAAGQSVRDGAREGMRKANQSLQRVRSILRTPRRKFSDDPAKVAAGTHMMSPPPMTAEEEALPQMPATAPAKKHVNFSSSTLSRPVEEDIGKSPSPMKFKAGTEVPTGAVIYPTLKTNGDDSAAETGKSPSDSPSRRLTFGGEPASQTRQFSFESGKPMDFGPTSTGTIRMVRQSDVSPVRESTKRRLANIEEVSDKENSQPAEEYRSAKKMKPTPATPQKTPARPSKPRPTPARNTPVRNTPARGSAISKSRLNFLATPKRGKA